MTKDRPSTLGELKSSGYRSQSVKDEIRRNLISKLGSNEPLFPDILGYEDTVVPQICNAILSKHDMLFLGLRGQAKTRMLRQLIHLLDDALPIVAGSEINDDPLKPVSKYARDLIVEKKDDTPIAWLSPAERYHEKLATPDVTIADLIGEVDMIKHAEGRYLSSEMTMHFGLIPRTNRGIFCINELPDLAPKIQVGLFNVLEERDVQIRGFPIRLDLDIAMVFSANPEDYTNRGRIVTPLKDRIGSVIRTHYPLTREIGIAISDQNAWLDRGKSNGEANAPTLEVPVFIKEAVEEIARLARTSPHVNQQSGVSVRMSIANLENVISNAERRAIMSRENVIVPRVSDLSSAVASARGKLELTMSEDDGHEDKLIHRVIDEAVKNIFTAHFDLRDLRPIVEYFESGQSVEVGDSLPSKAVVERIAKVPGLKKKAEEFATKALPTLSDREGREAAVAASAEFLLEGLHVHNKLNKSAKNGARSYRR